MFWDCRMGGSPVPRQNSGTFDFHLGNNVTNLSRNSLIFKVARHFGEAQATGSPFDMTRDTSASLGGPLMKDRWWLFGSYRRYDLNQRILAVIDQSGAAVKDINHQ